MTYLTRGYDLMDISITHSRTSITIIALQHAFLLYIHTLENAMWSTLHLQCANHSLTSIIHPTSYLRPSKSSIPFRD